ncbi:class I SAM-dependent methyltransferase [Stieleria varia]|uniref:Methyltransferase type 11 domain-containing protein n=1 Tax=Stieleria varia TaxID=2528005 RepID=A0A5C6B8D8_9BACT|nr:methyltransferase domain-containing protein [Stieleria varia]TWU08228.1 hypothetical protein Pla52n_08100 [Stieleria varia]
MQHHSSPKLLNVGCGRCYHDEWTNIDLVACGPGVRQYDLRKGLPYDDDTFDGVYHSHVLEHLAPADARSMLTECRRVLRPGGVLRIVVPDLEGIARTYLQTLDAAASHDVTDTQSTAAELDRANHHWMTLEMLDQLSRQRGGGEMGKVLASEKPINRDFLLRRMGHQVTGNSNRNDGGGKPRKTIGQRLRQVLNGLRKQTALAAVTLIEGQMGRAAYREGRFRQSGEIHRWMYDRVSLAALLDELGFDEPTVCAAHESRIESFDHYQLDRDGDQQRKPDSMYMEAHKRAASIAVGKSQTESSSASKAA